MRRHATAERAKVGIEKLWGNIEKTGTESIPNGVPLCGGRVQQ